MDQPGVNRDTVGLALMRYVCPHVPPSIPEPAFFDVQPASTSMSAARISITKGDVHTWLLWYLLVSSRCCLWPRAATPADGGCHQSSSQDSEAAHDSICNSPAAADRSVICSSTATASNHANVNKHELVIWLLLGECRWFGRAASLARTTSCSTARSVTKSVWLKPSVGVHIWGCRSSMRIPPSQVLVRQKTKQAAIPETSLALLSSATLSTKQQIKMIASMQRSSVQTATRQTKACTPVATRVHSRRSSVRVLAAQADSKPGIATVSICLLCLGSWIDLA